MPLRKEKPREAVQPPAKESEIDAIINKGGSVAASAPKKSHRKNYPLYFLQEDMRERIDRSVKNAARIKAKTVNEWINEAILDKLKAEE